MSISNMVVSMRLRHPVSNRILEDPRAHGNEGKFSAVCVNLDGFKRSTPQFHLGYDMNTGKQRNSMVFCAGIQSIDDLMTCAKEISEIATKYAVDDSSG